LSGEPCENHGMSETHTPPREFESDQPQDLPGWPKTIGIISIVWASLGLVCNSCGFAGPMIGRFFAGMAPPEKQAEIQQQMAANQPPAFLYVIMLGKVVLSVVLLSAGIMLLSRKAASRTLHLAWASLALLLVIGALVLGIMHAPEQAKKAQEAIAGAGPGAAGASFMSTSGALIGMAVGGAVITAIWPIFCLVWFGLMRKQPEAGIAEITA